MLSEQGPTVNKSEVFDKEENRQTNKKKQKNIEKVCNTTIH